MGLFKLRHFPSHSGKILPWKIDCDALTQTDWVCLAHMVTKIVGAFGDVEGVPRGGLKLAAVLEKHATSGPLLIVDDVLTTGESMERQRNGRDAIGVVVFSRGPFQAWIRPIFYLNKQEG